MFISLDVYNSSAGKCACLRRMEDAKNKLSPYTILHTCANIRDPTSTMLVESIDVKFAFQHSGVPRRGERERALPTHLLAVGPPGRADTAPSPRAGWRRTRAGADRPSAPRICQTCCAIQQLVRPRIKTGSENRTRAIKTRTIVMLNTMKYWL